MRTEAWTLMRSQTYKIYSKFRGFDEINCDIIHNYLWRYKGDLKVQYFLFYYAVI
jgi:hypothetical protein